jgi:hypothetical protein
MLIEETEYNATGKTLDRNSSIMTGSASKDISDHPILYDVCNMNTQNTTCTQCSIIHLTLDSERVTYRIK